MARPTSARISSSVCSGKAIIMCSICGKCSNAMSSTMHGLVYISFSHSKCNFRSVAIEPRPAKRWSNIRRLRSSSLGGDTVNFSSTGATKLEWLNRLYNEPSSSGPLKGARMLNIRRFGKWIGAVDNCQGIDSIEILSKSRDTSWRLSNDRNKENKRIKPLSLIIWGCLSQWQASSLKTRTGSLELNLGMSPVTINPCKSGKTQSSV